MHDEAVVKFLYISLFINEYISDKFKRYAYRFVNHNMKIFIEHVDWHVFTSYRIILIEMLYN